MRIGITGTESSHVDHIVRYCNVERRRAGVRVVALAGGASPRNIALAAAGGIRHLVDAPADLAGLVDAVLVCDRDARRHAGIALPFLAAGLPTFVDKPFADTLADATAMVRAAQASGAPLTSYSALRWLPPTAGLAGALAGQPPRLVVATGPADPNSRYAGIHFYGTHPVQVALQLAPGEIGEVRARRLPGAIVATAPVGDTTVVVNLVAGPPSVPFHAMAATETAVHAAELPLGDRYLDPGLDALCTMLDTGTPPVPYHELLRPVRFLDTLAASLAG